MSQTEKAAYYQALKGIGIAFDKPYREYTTAELAEAHQRGVQAGALQPIVIPPPKPPAAARAPQAAPGPIPQEGPADPEAAAFFGFELPNSPTPPMQLPQRGADPHELAGQRQNSKAEDEPIRTDDQGRVWFQEEVLKPAFPKARGRRVLTYQDPGVVQKQVLTTDGTRQYVETFEVSGDPANSRLAEVKITLPSFQVGIYKDPRFPFRVVCYNGTEGFHYDDVNDFYGGSELVPPEVKKMYVENVLAYDVRTVVRAINDEYRREQLAGRIQ